MTGRPRIIDDEKAAKLYLSGLGIVKVAEVLGVGPSTVKDSLRRSGTQTRAPGRARGNRPPAKRKSRANPVKRTAAIRFLAASGMDHRELAEAFRLPREVVAEALQGRPHEHQIERSMPSAEAGSPVEGGPAI